MPWPQTTVRQIMVGIAILALNMAVLNVCWRDMARDSYEVQVLGGITAIACFSYFWLPIFMACQPPLKARRSLRIAGALGGFGFVFGGFLAVRSGQPWQLAGFMFGLASLVPVWSAGLGYLLSCRRGRLQHGSERS